MGTLFWHLSQLRGSLFVLAILAMLFCGNLNAAPKKLNLVDKPNSKPLEFFSFELQKKGESERHKIATIMERFQKAEDISDEEYEELAAVLDGAQLPVFINSKEKEKFQPLLDKLDAHRINSEVYYATPKEISDFVDKIKPGTVLSRQMNKVLDWYKQYYEKPEKMDITLGVSYALFKGVTLTYILLVGGLGPIPTLLTVLHQVISSGIRSTLHRTIDNMYSGRKNTDTEPQYSKAREFGTRVTKDYLVSFFWRWIMGPLKDASSIFTLKGIFEVITNVSTGAILGNRLVMEKHRRLSLRGSRFFGFNAGLYFATLGSLDFSGFHFGTLAKIGAFEFHTSIAVIIGSFILSKWWLVKKPEQVEKMAEYEEKFFKKIGDGLIQLYQKAKNKCQLPLEKDSSESNPETIDLTRFNQLFVFSQLS